jgi:hypothetical protein
MHLFLVLNFRKLHFKLSTIAPESWDNIRCVMIYKSLSAILGGWGTYTW